MQTYLYAGSQCYYLGDKVVIVAALCRDSPQRQYRRQTAVGTHPRNATRGRLLSLPLSYRSWSGGGRKRASQLGDSDNG